MDRMPLWYIFGWDHKTRYFHFSELIYYFDVGVFTTCLYFEISKLGKDNHYFVALMTVLPLENI